MLPKWPSDASSHSVEGGTGKAEAAKLPDARIPEAAPRKMSGRKRLTY
jgi:hypothetical protein